MEAERAANKYKQVEYMQKFVGDVFDAVISGVSSFGFWAETVEQKCEGLVGLAELSLALKDEFAFLENDYALVGMHTGKRFRIGDKVKIQVLSANLEKRQIDFGYATENGEKQAKPAPKAVKKTKFEAEKGIKEKKRKNKGGY
jgi:ribonuclease R